MSSDDTQNSSENENSCVLCFKNSDTFSIGVCDHPVCFECSTRMRVLCRQNECPICRQDMPKVIFTKRVEPFSALCPKVDRSNLQDRKYGLYFCSPSIQRAYYRLLEHNCQLCVGENSRRWPFKTFQQLKDHMRREHELFYCDLCVENVKIFTFERRCYTRAELAQHRRKGDSDNTSHRGHPLCEFCDVRYVDSDELFRHLRRDHLYCHFCDADGKHQYYNSYDDLRNHFRDEHYLCEEGECKQVQFTHAFRTDIDYKAHMAAEHSKHLKGAAHKQARMLDIEFSLAPRLNRPDRGANRQQQAQPRDRGGYENGSTFDTEPGGTTTSSQNSTTFVNPLRSEDFPSLGNVDPQPPIPSAAFNSKYNSRHFTGDDFPTLGGSSSSRSAGVVITGKVNAFRTNDFPSLGKGSHSRTPDVTITHTRGNSAPQRKFKDFPTLEEAAGPSSTVRLSLKNPDRGSNVSIKVNNSTGGSITTHIRSEPKAPVQTRPKSSSEDFPALSKQSAPNPPQWVTAKPKKQQEPKTSKVAAAPVLPPSDLSDFPALSKPSKTDQKNKPENKNKKSSSVEVAMNQSWVNLNNFNSATKTRETKKTPITTESNNDAKSNSREQQNKKGDKGNNSTKDISKGSVKSDGKSSDFNDNKVLEGEGDGSSKSKNKKKKGIKANEAAGSVKKGYVSANSNNVNNNKFDLAGGEHRLNWESLVDEDASVIARHQNSQKNGMVKKRSELNIEALKINEEPLINQADFPVLGKPKPPPGFDSVKPPPGLVKPPPGINTLNTLLNKKTNSANIVLSPPGNNLTFTNSMGQSYSISPTVQYHPPANFQMRNKELIDNFMSVVQNNEVMKEFKSYSDLFRNGNYPAAQYYEHCKAILGSKFEKIFTELLVLLPDIEKQQELYKIHCANGYKQGLDVCATCKQIILSRDLKQHLTSHALETHFPVLGQPGVNVNNSWKK